LTCMKSQAEA